MISDLNTIYKAIEPFIKESNISLSLDSFIEYAGAEIDYKTIDDITYKTFDITSIKLKLSGVNSYLADRYGFESKVISQIKDYDSIFNQDEETTYNVDVVFYIAEDNVIRQYQVISLVELQYGGDSQEIIEFYNTDLYSSGIVTSLFDYYRLYFYPDNIPEEMLKPIDELVESERALIKMLLIYLKKTSEMV